MCLPVEDGPVTCLGVAYPMAGLMTLNDRSYHQGFEACPPERSTIVIKEIKTKCRYQRLVALAVGKSREKMFLKGYGTRR
jgi:hypothetical protein